MEDVSNKMFQLATELVCGTHSNIFLTGKAGTGKTTFLKHIKEISGKNLAVVAPTGVAAINAGGTTIHSFFQLPFSPFLPASTPASNTQTLNAHTLLGRMKLTNERRLVLRQLELLIIDEISMVRADTLDAIDLVLRHFRFRNDEPFGGVQVLMIGDMYQIPPVIKKEEWQLLSQFYKSGYFFDSRVMHQAATIHIEFTKIYRQQDERFVRLLNQVRNNKLDAEGKQLLADLYKPGVSANELDDCIILTTHNAKADSINNNRMDQLKTRSQFFAATIDGEFSDKAYPAELNLHLKIGAQVMFIKNDTEKIRRYFNGKIGKVSKFDDDKIWVQLDTDGEEIEVKKEKWDNIRYGLNNKSQEIEEDVIGSFTQYPLRLAWAVTIHKSQGLTFEKAVIDAGEAFSPGQVYVALSRCTSLDGVVLLSPIQAHRLINDDRIVQFSNQHHPEEKVQALLHIARHRYQEKLLEDLFDFTLLQKDLSKLQKFILDNAKSFQPDLVLLIDKLLNQLDNIFIVSRKFSVQRRFLYNDADYPEKNNILQARLCSASVYFSSQLESLLQEMENLKAITESRQNAKEYNELYKEVYLQIVYKKSLIQSSEKGFTVSAFNQAKKEFVAPYINVNAYALSNKDVVPTSPHPLLHQKLRKLRATICEASNLPIYLVAPAKTIDELAIHLPQDKEQLLQILGFGKTKVDKYGDRFLAVIKAYCEENNIMEAPGLNPANKKKQTKKSSSDIKPSSSSISYELFKSGLSVEAIAVERKLTKGTVYNHLIDFIESGQIEISQIVDRSKIDTIIAAIQENKDENGIGSIKNILGNDFTYTEIKAVDVHLKALENNNKSISN